MNTEPVVGREKVGCGTKELRQITVEAYRDADGRPTCCADWGRARCRFVVSRNLGTFYSCTAVGEDLLLRPYDLPYKYDLPNLDDVKDDKLLRPIEGCPVWGT